MIEGEEEIGSEHLGIFVAENKKKLAADMILISDTSMLSLEHPSITTGLKGLSYLQVEVTGPNRDLHSGTLWRCRWKSYQYSVQNDRFSHGFK